MLPLILVIITKVIFKLVFRSFLKYESLFKVVVKCMTSLGIKVLIVKIENWIELNSEMWIFRTRNEFMLRARSPLHLLSFSKSFCQWVSQCLEKKNIATVFLKAICFKERVQQSSEAYVPQRFLMFPFKTRYLHGLTLGKISARSTF